MDTQFLAAAYVGDQKIAKIYAGDQFIWPDIWTDTWDGIWTGVGGN